MCDDGALLTSGRKKNVTAANVHSESTTLPQVFHRRVSPGRRSRVVGIAAALLLTILATLLRPFPAVAQTPAPHPSPYRVFLKAGEALECYGESTRVDDRLIFNLIVRGSEDETTLQLVSLPLAAVDLDRTTRYADAIRATLYAATRGEADYAAMTAEVARALDQLARVEDPRRRLELAREARRRLVNWSREHFSYRAGEIAQLAGMFDEVIGELAAAAGESSFTMELSRAPVRPPVEPLLPAASHTDSLASIRAAAAAALGQLGATASGSATAPSTSPVDGLVRILATDPSALAEASARDLETSRSFQPERLAAVRSQFLAELRGRAGKAR
jgi:hypothetical protein